MARQPAVTEHDLRMPEFRGVCIDELERREDGTIARKDRWERCVRSIVAIVGIPARETFEVTDVIAAVEELRRRVDGVA